MKRQVYCIFIVILILCSLFSGCSSAMSAETTESAIRDIIECTNIYEWSFNSHSDNYTSDGIHAYAEKNMLLKELIQQDNSKELLQEYGIPLIEEYTSSNETLWKANAITLGEFISILYPDLAEEIDSIIG